MLAITSLLVAACAEDIDNNNLGKPLISFGVNEPYAAVADSNEPAATRSFNATDAFTPGNNLFSNAVYASDADKQSAANRVQVDPLEGDYPQELCMLVSKEPWPQPSTATRATENTTAVLNASGKQIGIYSSIYSGNADYSTSSSKFEPTTATAWPTTGSSSTAYDIYAWHPTTFTSTGISMSGQTFNYTLPTTSAAMVDLIGTKESHSYSENNDGSISLTFNHLLAPVCFKLAAGLSGTITSIKFSNIVTTGTYTLGATHADDATYGYTWTATTTGAYTASVSGTGGASEVQVDGSHYFMMIPQTVAAGVVVTITITDGASQSNTLTYTVPSGGQVWKAGQVTTYTISTSTITSFTLTYPQWTESGGSGTTYGPVDNYDVTTEDYGYVGLFAVDKANKIVISNAKVKITSAASHVGTCDLTDAANTAVLGNYILSQNYAYYVYYPYKSSLTGIPTNDQTTYSTLAQSAAAQATLADAADTFFANVINNWSVVADQSSGIQSSDLQVAKMSGYSLNMIHKMAKICVRTTNNGTKIRKIEIKKSDVSESTVIMFNNATGSTDDVICTALIPQQSLVAETSSIAVTMGIGSPLTFNLPTDANLDAGKEYAYHVSVTDPGVPLADITSEHLGLVVAQNGKVYTSIEQADTYSTALAMIVYVGTALGNHGLAYALEYASSNTYTHSKQWSVVSSWAADKAVENAVEWRSPTMSDYYYMFEGFGGTSHSASVSAGTYWSTGTFKQRLVELGAQPMEAVYHLINRSYFYQNGSYYSWSLHGHSQNSTSIIWAHLGYDWEKGKARAVLEW